MDKIDGEYYTPRGSSKGKHVVTDVVYQPSGTLVKIGTRKRPDKYLKVGRWLTKTRWLSTTKDYK